MFKELATIRETARRAKEEHIGITENALREWTKAGILPYKKCGNRKYLYWANVIAFVAAGETANNTTPPRYGPGSRGGRRSKCA